jgi:hypothetical protein
MSIQDEKRKRFLENLIQEAVINVLAEQEQDGQQQQQAVPPSSVPPAPETNQPEVQTPVDQQPENQQTEFTVDDVIKKLNVLRGGKSLTDPEIYGRLTTFFKDLDESKRESLNFLLTELGKVVIGAEEETAGLQHGQDQQQQNVAPSRQVQQSPPANAQTQQAPVAPIATP